MSSAVEARVASITSCNEGPEPSRIMNPERCASACMHDGVSAKIGGWAVTEGFLGGLVAGGTGAGPKQRGGGKTISGREQCGYRKA